MVLVPLQDLRALAEHWPVLPSPPHSKTQEPLTHKAAKIALNFYSNLPYKARLAREIYFFLSAGDSS